MWVVRGSATSNRRLRTVCVCCVRVLCARACVYECWWYEDLLYQIVACLRCVCVCVCVGVCVRVCVCVCLCERERVIE